MLLVALLCLVVPASAVKTYLFGDPPQVTDVPKMRLQASVAANCLLLGFIGWVAMKTIGIQLLRPWRPTIVEFAAGPLSLAIALGAYVLLAGWLRADPRRRPSPLLPTGSGEMGMWLVVSVAAGIGEEMAYRGALFLTLSWWTGSQWTALAVGSLAFAVAHLRQGLRATVFILAFGMLMQLLVMVSGSLYMAMLVHAAYDLVLGLAAVRASTVNPPGTTGAQSAIFHP